LTYLARPGPGQARAMPEPILGRARAKLGQSPGLWPSPPGPSIL